MMDIQTSLVAGIGLDDVSLTCPGLVKHLLDNPLSITAGDDVSLTCPGLVNHLLDNPLSITAGDDVSLTCPGLVNHLLDNPLSTTASSDILHSQGEVSEKVHRSDCSSPGEAQLDNVLQNATTNIYKAAFSNPRINVLADACKDVLSIPPTNEYSVQNSHIPLTTEKEVPNPHIPSAHKDDVPNPSIPLTFEKEVPSPRIPPTNKDHVPSPLDEDRPRFPGLRRSIASSGIGGDEAPSSRSTLSSGDYSSCVSVTSLDEDDEDFLSSIVINTDTQDIRRATSMDIRAAPANMCNRSVSLDDKNTPSNSDPIRADHVTTIRINPGFESRLLTPPEVLNNDGNFDETDRLFNRDDCKRDSQFRNRHLNGLRSSLINLTSNPGYMKFIDEHGDESETQHNDEEVANEGGVKFIDDDGDSICSSEDVSEDEKAKSKAPDGGWGWVIVASSFFISVIADGISFSFGLLYIEFLRHFNASSSQTSLIGSLFMSVPLLTGPISSALVDRYGCRIMTIIGGVIAGSGFVASAFQDSIEMMYLTFGLIAGLGLGLCYVTAVVSIAYWFDKKRTLATGLGACGTGFGTVVYARMTSYFIAEFGWRGTVLLLAGTLFNMCVGGALMRDPEWWAIEQAGNKAGSVAGTKSIRGAGSSCGSLSGMADVEQLRRMLKRGETPEYLLTGLATTTAGDREGEEEGGETGSNKYRSVVNLPTFVRQSEKVPLEVLESLSANRRVFNVILENYPSLLLCRSVSDGSKLSDHVTTCRVPVTMSVRVEAAVNNNNTPPQLEATPDSADKSDTPMPPDLGCTRTPPPAGHKSILSKGAVERHDSLKKQVTSTHQPTAHYLKNIRVHRNSVMYRGAMLNIHRYRLRASSCPDIYRNSMTTIAKENEEKWYGDMPDLLRGMVDFSMFLELHFLLMSVATVLLFTWFIVPYFYLADHVTLNHYDDQQVSSLLMIIGVTNFIGMVGLGWAGDQPWMNVTKTYAFCLVACGLATLAMPYVTSSYALLACACALFGLFFASSFSFTPVILVQLIPLERFTTAYGLSLMCQGIGSLVGPPLAGWIYDRTRTYDLSFYMAGLWIIVAGVLMAIIPVTTNRKIWGHGPIEKDKVSLSDNRDTSYA